jgi:hypothetical protein
MQVLEKYIPLALAIALTAGAIYIERSIFSAGLPIIYAYHWLSYGIGIFVFLLWVVAMFVIAVTYKDLREERVIFSGRVPVVQSQALLTVQGAMRLLATYACIFFHNFNRLWRSEKLATSCQ